MVPFRRSKYLLFGMSACEELALTEDADPSRLGNRKALCQRRHMPHNRVEHRRRRVLTQRGRNATGDVFLGRHLLSLYADEFLPLGFARCVTRLVSEISS